MSNLRTDHEIEIDQIYDRQLAEKDAEIARLKAENETLKAHMSAAGLVLREKDLVIETMNEAYKLLIAEKVTLITELADALEKQSCWSTKVELIQRAREATR